MVYFGSVSCVVDDDKAGIIKRKDGNTSGHIRHLKLRHNLVYVQMKVKSEAAGSKLKFKNADDIVAELLMA